MHYDQEIDVEELALELHRRIDRCRSWERFQSDYLRFVMDHVLDTETIHADLQHEDWLDHRTCEQLIESRVRLTVTPKARFSLDRFINPETMPVTASYVAARHPTERDELRIHTRIPTMLYSARSSPSLSEMTEHAKLKHELQLMHAIHKRILRRLVP